MSAIRKKPNFLFITADQLRADALGCYGNRVVKTPNIDGIARKGVRFENCFVQNPLCMPSRASILTGRYPHSHGCWTNGVVMPDTEITLPGVLTKAGYRTAAVGKMHFIPPKRPYGFQKMIIHDGMEHLGRESDYSDFIKTNYPELTHLLRSRRDPAWRGKEYLPYPSSMPAKLHDTAWIAEQAINFIKQTGSRPFFVWCSFVDPHHAFNPPAPYHKMYRPEQMPLPLRKKGELKDKPPHFMDMYKGRSRGNERFDFSGFSDSLWRNIIAHYYGMISLIDKHIGRILAFLEESGLEKNTVVMLASDHGELLGDHGLLFKGPFHYDSLIRIPFLGRIPGISIKRRKIAALVRTIDFMPTLLELAGSKIPPGVEGVSLLPLIKGKVGKLSDYIICENREADWDLEVYTIRSKSWKLTWYRNKPYGELYNLKDDPGEFRNLWKSQRQQTIRKKLKKELQKRIVLLEDNELPPRVAKY